MSRSQLPGSVRWRHGGSVPWRHAPRAGGAGAAALAIAALIGACGGGASSPRLKPVDYVRVYASLPSGGPSGGQGEQVANGIALALSQVDNRAGDYDVRYRQLDAQPRGASGPAAEAWSAAANARRAAADPSTVLYIGELGSDPNRASIPILNVAGVPQISPTSTEAGLTVRVPGTPVSDEPGNYYPRGSRTFMRLLPNDAAQAEASLLELSAARCKRVALAFDSSGTSLAQLIASDAPRFDLAIVSSTALTAPASASLLRFQLAVRGERPDCVEIAGSATPTTVEATTRAHAVAPIVQLFLGSSGMCVPAWTNELDGGVPALLDHLLMCTKPTLPLGEYPGGGTFRQQYMQKFGGAEPDVDALLGYTAMEIGLDTIASLGRNGDERSAVLNGLLHWWHETPLGTFSFDHNGDTTLDVYGLYKVGDDGDPVFAQTLSPRSGP